MGPSKSTISISSTICDLSSLADQPNINVINPINSIIEPKFRGELPNQHIVHYSNERSDSSLMSDGAVNKQPIPNTGKRFGSDMRQYTNDSPHAPEFDKYLREIMEPHIAKARKKREECRNKLLKKIGFKQNSRDLNTLSIASNVSVPYPSLRQERNFLYDVETYPLHQLLAETLGTPDLSLLHLNSVQDKKALLKPLLHRRTRRAFHECYDNFVTTFCIPLLHSIAMTQNIFSHNLRHPGQEQICYRYQAFPCLRVIRPGEFSIGPHCDTSYGHSIGNINFHVPLTPAYGTNALYTESHPGRENWHPLTTKSQGLGFIFDGGRCLHFTMENTTAHTRVSLDFRIAICRHDFSKSRQMLNRGKTEDEIGAESDANVLLSCEKTLQDNYTSFPGYYEEAFIDVGTTSEHNFHFSPGPVYKKNPGKSLLDPDKRNAPPRTIKY